MFLVSNVVSKMVQRRHISHKYTVVCIFFTSNPFWAHDISYRRSSKWLNHYVLKYEFKMPEITLKVQTTRERIVAYEIGVKHA